MTTDQRLSIIRNDIHNRSKDDNNQPNDSKLINILTGAGGKMKSKTASSSKTHLLDELFQLEANISSQRIRVLQGQKYVVVMKLQHIYFTPFLEYRCYII